MFGIYGTSAEDRSRERELNRYLDQQHEESDEYRAELLMQEVAKRLTRQRSVFGQPCAASLRVFEAIGETDVNGANALTDLIQWGAERGEWDDCAIGKLIREQVVAYVSSCIDVDLLVRPTDAMEE